MATYKFTLSAGYYKDPLTGKRKQNRKQVTVEAPNKREAEKEHKRLQAEYSAQHENVTQVTTFRQLVEAYYKARELKPKTIAGDRFYFTKLLAYFGDTKLTDITSQSVEVYLQNLAKVVPGREHLHNFRKTLKKYLRYAYVKEYISSDIFAHVDTDIGKSTKAKAPKPDLLQNTDTLLKIVLGKSGLKDTFTNVKFKLMLLLAADCCLRNTELYGLLLSDFNFEAKTVSIVRDAYTITKEEAATQGVPPKAFTKTKTDGSARELPLSQITIDYLLKYNDMHEQYLREHGMTNPGQYLFTQRFSSKNYTPVAELAYGSGFSGRLYDFCKSRNMIFISPHDFRRIGRTKRLILKVPDAVCEYLLGHNPDKVKESYTLEMLTLSIDCHKVWEAYLNECAAFEAK